MPEMDGTETFKRLKALDPEVKVVVFSGYNRDDLINELLEDGAVGYLQKPFDHRELSKELAGAL